MPSLTQELKGYIKAQGASLVGVASPDRFEGSPKGHSPTELFAPTRAVISIGVQVPEGIVAWDRFFTESAVIPPEKRQAVAQSHWYIRCGYETVNSHLERLGLLATLYLEEHGFPTIFTPATYAHHAPIMEQVPGFMAPICHRHAAVRAGHGEFGLNNLVVTREYGPRIRFITIMTAAPLDADPLIQEPICLRGKCGKCVTACKLSAVRPLDKAANGGVLLNMPSEIDKWSCYHHHAEVGCQGLCMRVCPVGRK